MKHLNRLAALLLCPIIIACSAACSDNSDRRIYFEISEAPSSLDPQTASTDTELMIVRNLYEGLMRLSSSGELIPGVAEGYEKNGLVYTFHLRESACWYTGDELTAEDFVFGIRRAADPATCSPFAERLQCIAGATEVLSGAADKSALAVNALDKHTLQITLAYEDEDFLKSLATSTFMPCNESFFNESVGKYGLEKSYMLTNGSYYLAKWNKTDFGIRIYKNAVYSGEFTAKNGGVFFSKNEDSSPYSELSSGAADAAFIKSDELKKAEKAGFKAAAVENICWVLTLSNEYSPQMRKALCSLINREALVSKQGSSFRAAYSIYPEIFGAVNAENIGITPYDQQLGKELFSEAVKNTEDKKFPKTTLIYSESSATELINDMIGHWQQKLSAFINMQAAKSPEALINQLTQQTEPMAVFPIIAKSNSINEYLNSFNFSDSSAPAAAQQQLLKENNIAPLFFEKTCIAYSSKLSEFNIDNTGGYIDFSQLIKSE